MDWTNELFVRLYVRDTADWKVLPWQARCLFPLLLRRVDRAGVLETRHGVKGVAALVDMPVDVVEPGLAALLEDGSVTQHDRGYLLPNFIDAQEANKSDKVRAKEYRDKRRAKALVNITPRDGLVTPRDPSVTAHHTASHGVTARHSENRREETRQDEARGEEVAAKPKARRPSKPPAEPSGDHQTFIARFTELYAAKNLGSRPTWGAKQGKQVKGLLALPGGIHEALRRAENMFAAPPPWPPPPHDLGTLVQHYDRFARPHSNGAKVGHYQHTGDEEYAGGDVDL